MLNFPYYGNVNIFISIYTTIYCVLIGEKLIGCIDNMTVLGKLACCIQQVHYPHIQSMEPLIVDSFYVYKGQRTHPQLVPYSYCNNTLPALVYVYSTANRWLYGLAMAAVDNTDTIQIKLV